MTRSSKTRVLISFGTRPEAVKMASVVEAVKERASFDCKVCVTAQHRQMLDQVLELTGIQSDYDLNLMTPNQSLDTLTARGLTAMGEVLDEFQPDVVLVQGDTTTTFFSTLAAFYRKIKVGHVEAGLRTYNLYAPFPEEVNRQLTSRMARWHFAPTQRAYDALLAEQIAADKIFITGNTVVDALLKVVDIAKKRSDEIAPRFQSIDLDRRVLLVTGHRRENFGEGFQNICDALRRIAERNPDLSIVYPVHLNPNVQQPVKSTLQGLDNVYLIEPLDYLSFVWLLDQSHIVLTDSGGIQEEAPSLGKPVLVMRETTERPEAVESGVAKLVGTDTGLIADSVQTLLDSASEYNRMSRAQNPYGDGTSGIQIADILEEAFR
ncbi:UDP-N-acetylglucosamine 2-epimerase (non-hydrolyzing) [bacterium]|nr:UDP-N-acetylglucosamine 2-epimerase (non-hydrolyzing) [bacterium]